MKTQFRVSERFLFYKALPFLGLFTLIVGCKKVEWDHESYESANGPRGQDIAGYTIRAALMPQTRYGESGMSYKGPYKVRVTSIERAGDFEKYTHLVALKAAVTFLESNQVIEMIGSPVEVEFKEVGSNFAANLIFERTIQPSFQSREQVEAIFDLELVNNFSSSSKKFSISFLFLPKHSSGESDVPLVTQ